MLPDVSDLSTRWMHRKAAIKRLVRSKLRVPQSTRKLCYRKDDRAKRLIYGCPENFRDSLAMPTATFPKIFHGLLFWFILWMCVQNLKSVALPNP